MLLDNQQISCVKELLDTWNAFVDSNLDCFYPDPETADPEKVANFSKLKKFLMLKEKVSPVQLQQCKDFE